MWSWEESVNVVSTYYKEPWTVITRWNIIYYIYRHEFIAHQHRKELRNKPPQFKKR